MRTAFDFIKYWFWRLFIYPIFPVLRPIGTVLPVVKEYGPPKETGRQRFRLGWIAAERTLEDVLRHLTERHGFKNHFVAWNDRGQVISLRKLIQYRYQYHIRIFEDGEVRGHYEFSPEARPVAHLIEEGMEERRQEFLSFLHGFIRPDRDPGDLKRLL